MAEYDGYEYTELSLDEMCNAVRGRIKEYEARKFQLLLDSKAESLGQSPNKNAAIREMSKQMSDLDRALEMCRQELATLETDKPSGDGDGEI